MLNKTATISTQEQAVARILRVSTLYLSLTVPATGMAQLAAPLPVGAPAAITVQTNEPKLMYKASGAKLTVEELEAAQQKKLEEDFYKKAGYTSTPPVVAKPIKANTGVAAAVVAKPVSTLFVSGIYGTAAQQKAEVVWNGVTSTVEMGAMLGSIMIESIQAGKVTVVYTGKAAAVTKKRKGKTTSAPASALRQTLKAGETLEIPA